MSWATGLEIVFWIVVAFLVLIAVGTFLNGVT
jgi:hypothetical protein